MDEKPCVVCGIRVRLNDNNCCSVECEERLKRTFEEIIDSMEWTQ